MQPIFEFDNERLFCKYNCKKVGKVFNILTIFYT